MLSNRTVTAIIPARAGSTRLPGKNHLDVGGHTPLAWAMRCVQGSRYVDRTVLSTDDRRLMDEAVQYDTLTVLPRPPALATAEARSEDVLRHAIAECALDADIVVLLQLTSPLRESADVDATLEAMQRRHADAAVAVCRWRIPASPPFGPVERTDRLGAAAPVGDAARTLNDRRWSINGAVYATKAEKFLASGKLYDEHAAIHVMPNWRSVDIDYEDDWKLADALIRQAKQPAP